MSSPEMLVIPGVGLMATVWSSGVPGLIEGVFEALLGTTMLPGFRAGMGLGVVREGNVNAFVLAAVAGMLVPAACGGETAAALVGVRRIRSERSCARLDRVTLVSGPGAGALVAGGVWAWHNPHDRRKAERIVFTDRFTLIGRAGSGVALSLRQGWRRPWLWLCRGFWRAVVSFGRRLPALRWR